MLAFQSRTVRASRLIPKIKSPKGDVVSDPEEINLIFSKYYSDLYSSECNSKIWKGPNPFDQLIFPCVTDGSTDDLGRPVSIIEVQEAIHSLQNGKSPGPDGFTIEFYKTFSSVLAPILQ